MREARAACLALLLALATTGPLHGETYTLDLACDPVASTLQGTAQVDFDPGEVEGGAFLLLYNNLLARRNPADNPLLEDIQYAHGFTPGFTRVTSVTDAAGSPVAFTAAESRLLANLVTYPVKDFLLRLELPGGEEQPLGITVRFITRLPQLLSGDQTALGESFVQRFLWFPKLASNDGAFGVDSFRYKARIALPRGWQLISSGREQRLAEVTWDGGSLWTLDSGEVPRAGIPLAIVREGSLSESRLQAAGRTLRALAKPAHAGQAAKILRFAAAALAHFEDTLGPLPEGPVTFVEGTVDGLWGMTGDSFVLLGRGAFTADLVLPEMLDPLLDFLVSHEVAHLWFGIGAGTDFTRENWLSESLAQYASVDWIEQKRGTLENYFQMPGGAAGKALRLLLPWNSLRDSMAESILGVRRSGWDFPLLAPPSGQIQNGYQAVLYDRGAMAVRQLRLEAGEERFDAALRAYCEAYRGRRGSTEAFLEVLEGEAPGTAEGARRILGQRLSSDWTVQKIEAAGTGAVVSFADRSASGLASLAVIETDRERIPVRLEGAAAAVEVEGTVASVRVDPRWTTLDTDRRNNSWPRRLNFPFSPGSPFDADTLAPALALQAASSGGQTLIGVAAGMRWSTVGMTSVSAEAGVLPAVAFGPAGFGAWTDGYASVIVGFPRSLDLEAWASGSGGLWRAGTGLRHTIWLRTPTGMPSTFLAPAISWRIAAGVDQDAVLAPSAAVDVEGLYAPLPFLLHLGVTGAVALPAGEPASWASLESAWRVQTEAGVLLRILPRFYAVPVLDGALAFPAPGAGIVPGRLRAGSAAAGDGRGYAGLDLLFPIVNGLEVRLANLAILRSVFGGAYGEAERVFTGPPTVAALSPDTWDLRAGVQLGVTLASLAGLVLPLAAGVDIAVGDLVRGTVDLPQSLRFFLSAHVPTSFYAANLTW